MLLKNWLFYLGSLLHEASGAPASSEKWPADGTYQNTVLKHHNVHRQNHSAAELKWSNQMVKSAKILAQSCIWGHNQSINGGGYGQNIAAGVEKSHVSTVITELFYNNEVNNFADFYGETQPDFSNFANWGHFTQVVWKSTNQVGCFTSDCPKGLKDQKTGKNLGFGNYTVCNYYPPGNYVGEFGQKVGEPLGMPTVHSQY